MKLRALAAGFFAAVMISGLLWMAAILFGVTIRPEVYLSLALTVAAAVPMLNWLKDGLLTLSAELHDEVAKWKKLAAPPPAAPTAPLPAATQRTDVLESIITAREAGWRTAKWVFFQNGERAKCFTQTALGGSMPEGQWARWCRFYSSAAGKSVLKLLPGAGGYVLNDGLWTHEGVMKAIEDGSLPSPFPNEEPPRVTPVGSNAARRSATRRAPQAATE